MDIIIIMILSSMAFVAAGKIAGKTGLEIQIVYLLTGIISGWLITELTGGTIGDLMPALGGYNTVALLLMFFTAGFSINITALRKSGKITARLFSIPAYTETFVMTVVIFLMLKLIPGLGISLSPVEILMISAIFAGASPANIIPSCINLINKKYTDRNNLPGTMIIVAVIDGFITVPLIFAAAFVLMGENRGVKAGAMEMVQIIIMIILGLAGALALGYAAGRIQVKITGGLFGKIKEKLPGKAAGYIIAVTAFAVALVIVMMLRSIEPLRKTMTLFGILVILGIGVAINNSDGTEMKDVIRDRGNKIFSVFGMPMIFIYVGAGINIKVLLTPGLLIFFVIITLVAVTVKGFATKSVLRDKIYTKGERKFAAVCFIPKGVALTNFSVIFGGVLGENTEMLEFMSMLSAISIILTMTVGIGLLNRAEDRMIFRKEE